MVLHLGIAGPNPQLDDTRNIKSRFCCFSHGAQLQLQSVRRFVGFLILVQTHGMLDSFIYNVRHLVFVPGALLFLGILATLASWVLFARVRKGKVCAYFIV
jgi:energy-converting hydrogenase Eha subunit F